MKNLDTKTHVCTLQTTGNVFNAYGHTFNLTTRNSMQRKSVLGTIGKSCMGALLACNLLAGSGISVAEEQVPCFMHTINGDQRVFAGKVGIDGLGMLHMAYQDPAKPISSAGGTIGAGSCAGYSPTSTWSYFDDGGDVVEVDSDVDGNWAGIWYDDQQQLYVQAQNGVGTQITALGAGKATQYSMDVAALPNLGFVAGYKSQDPLNPYNQNITVSVQEDTSTPPITFQLANTHSEDKPRVDVYADGTGVVAFEDYVVVNDRAYKNVVAQRFDLDGTLIGGYITITENTGNTILEDVLALANGSIAAIARVSGDVYLTSRDSSGALSYHLEVNPGKTSYKADAEVLADGRIAVAFESKPYNGLHVATVSSAGALLTSQGPLLGLNTNIATASVIATGASTYTVIWSDISDVWGMDFN